MSTAAIEALPPAVLRRLLDAREAELSLASFVRQAWSFFHAEPIIWNWHIQTICDHLEAVTRGDINRLIINVPPGMAKSLLVSVFWPSWVWALQPKFQWLCISGTPPVAVRDALRMKELVLGSWYRPLVKNWVLNPGQKSKTYFLNSAGGSRISRSTGMRVTGLRGDGVVIDDPLDAREALGSPEVIQECNDWVDFALKNRVNNPRDPFVLIMQRLHDNDLTGHLLRRGGWEHLVLPAEFDPDLACSTSIFKDPRTQSGELLFPGLLDRQALDEYLETLGSLGYAAQYGQRPAPAEGALFKRGWFKWWQTLPERFDYRAWSWDLTYKKSKHSNYVVGQYWGVAGANKYLLRQRRAKMNLPQTKRVVREEGLEYPADAVLIENTANGPAVIEALSEEVSGIIPIDPQGNSKESRAAVASVQVEAGNVYLPDPKLPQNRWVTQHFLPEVLMFPVSSFDDQVDSMSQFLVWHSQQFQTPWTASLRGKKK